MPTPNPKYTPDWETVYDVRKAVYDDMEARQKEAAEEMSRLHRAQGEQTPEYYEARQAWREITQNLKEQLHAVQECFEMQHPTIQEYAQWVWEKFDPGTPFFGDSPVLVEQPDFEGFKSLEDVHAAWSRVHNAVEEQENAHRGKMEIGRPEGQDIFTQRGDNEVMSFHREFTLEDKVGHSNTANMWGFSTNAIVTIDSRPDHVHVCFSHNDTAGGTSVTNAIEDIATVLLNEARQATRETRAQSDKSLKTFFQRLTGQGLPTASDFTFYIHIPPGNGVMGKEKFDRINMAFSNGRFKNPQWHEYDVIPETIQTAPERLIQKVDFDTAPRTGLPYYNPDEQ